MGNFGKNCFRNLRFVLDQIKSGDLVRFRTPCRVPQIKVHDCDFYHLAKKLDFRISGYYHLIEKLHDPPSSKIRTCNLNFFICEEATSIASIDYIRSNDYMFFCGDVSFVLNVHYVSVFDAKPWINYSKRTIQLTTLLHREKTYLFACWHSDINDFLRKIT